MDSASDPDQEYIYFMGSETLPSACYTVSDESSIPFYSTSNGNKNKKAFCLEPCHRVPTAELKGITKPNTHIDEKRELAIGVSERQIRS